MEVISGIASASQLCAYSHSTFQVVVRLYKKIKDGPSALRQQESTVRVLLAIVDSIKHRPASAHIIEILVDLSVLATEAYNLITQSQSTGLLGLCLATLRYEPALAEIFASIRDKREILHFAISVEARQTAQVPQDCIDTMPDSGSEKIKKILKHFPGYSNHKLKDSGKDNRTMVGNGKADGTYRKSKVTLSGKKGKHFVGNTEGYDRKKHGDLFRSSQSDDEEESDREPDRSRNRSTWSEPKQLTNGRASGPNWEIECTEEPSPYDSLSEEHQGKRVGKEAEGSATYAKAGRRG